MFKLYDFLNTFSPDVELFSIDKCFIRFINITKEESIPLAHRLKKIKLKIPLVILSIKDVFLKVIDQPIKVMSVFYPDGKIEPLKFRLNDTVVSVEKVMTTYEEKIVGNKRIIFVYMHNNKDIYELKYEVGTKIWYLFKQ